MKSIRYGLVGLGMTLAASAIPAHAATQTVGGFSFSTSGSAANTKPIPITAFSASGTLTAVKLYFQAPLPQYGGEAAIGCLGGSCATPTTFTAFGKPTFTFSNGQQLIADDNGLITLTPNSTNGATVTAAASGNFNGAGLGGIPTTGNPALQAYFSGSPQITSYNTVYSSDAVPTGNGGGVVFNGLTQPPVTAPTLLSGQFFIQYEYTPSPGASTPGPVPLLGAGAAFAYSRQIRRRIKASV